MENIVDQNKSTIDVSPVDTQESKALDIQKVPIVEVDKAKDESQDVNTKYRTENTQITS